MFHPIDLRPGERVETPTGPVTIRSLEIRAGTQRVYNLEVEQVHSYLTSGLHVLSHNGCAHKNSKGSTAENHRYEIREKSTDDVVKTGISGQKLNKNGESPRANKQVNKWNKKAGYEKYEAEVVEKGLPGRAAALNAEQQATNRLKKAGNSLVRQQKAKPQ
ncbi:MAG: hypothetical protein H6709_06730 [Kofleriaceae bacterium]|nr:hypothetical protein [Myxococcales bacterium]MCA9856586.1 hypothetical protein [Dehalococcoidia bacterium]MCB9560299.1 hypothetical protein [Kofleriaceae bacterium]MCB9571771.1 hypothetical protein [Kofleriaceae bacterium]